METSACKSKGLGQKANDTRPEIEQIIFVKKNMISRTWRKLFVIRKKLKIKRQRTAKWFLYFSLSSKSVIYKGMFLAENIADLSD